MLTIQGAGKADQALPDDAVLGFAKEAGRAVLTLNRRHFIRLHRVNSTDEGIIVCTFDPDFIGQAERIDKAIASLPSLLGQLIRVNRR